MTATAFGAKLETYTPLKAMSEKQFTALLAKFKEDAGLREKFKGAADLDAAVALAKEAGFDVSKADLLKFQAEQTLELNDSQLEAVSGGKMEFGSKEYTDWFFFGGGPGSSGGTGL